MPKSSTTSLEVMRYCVVLGCKNTGHELRNWKKSFCSKHENETPETCGCRPPFILFPFPDSHKLQKLWLQRIGLTELEVSKSTCICSIHFVEGKPTSRSFFPTLYLQLDLSDDEDSTSVREDPLNDITLELSEEKDMDDAVSESEEFPIIKSAFHYEEEQPETEMEIFSRSPLDIEFQDEKSSNSQTKETFNHEGTSACEKSIVPDDFTDDEEESSIQPDQIDDPAEDNEVEFLFSAPKVVPLASYDPAAQTLQISNPVKYILECHNRIAQLLAENEQLKKVYETDLLLLKSQNKSLKRKLLRVTKKVNRPVGAVKPRFKMLNKKGTENSGWNKKKPS